jgi:alkylation response protein AidB-like acyl-CoA dehydrogenase
MKTSSSATSQEPIAFIPSDEFVINGQKVFITGADSADYIFTFVRTDPTADAHRAAGIDCRAGREVGEVGSGLRL